MNILFFTTTSRPLSLSWVKCWMLLFTREKKTTKISPSSRRLRVRTNSTSVDDVVMIEEHLSVFNRLLQTVTSRAYKKSQQSSTSRTWTLDVKLISSAGTWKATTTAAWWRWKIWRIFHVFFSSAQLVSLSSEKKFCYFIFSKSVGGGGGGWRKSFFFVSMRFFFLNNNT